MTIGVLEALALLIIWLATMLTLTVMTVCDAIRRRRDSWRRYIRTFDPRRP